VMPVCNTAAAALVVAGVNVQLIELTKVQVIELTATLSPLDSSEPQYCLQLRFTMPTTRPRGLVCGVIAVCQCVHAQNQCGTA
jgi:hypothetical protein